MFIWGSSHDEPQNKQTKVNDREVHIWILYMTSHYRKDIWTRQASFTEEDA